MGDNFSNRVFTSMYLSPITDLRPASSSFSNLSSTTYFSLNLPILSILFPFLLTKFAWKEKHFQRWRGLCMDSDIQEGKLLMTCYNWENMQVSWFSTVHLMHRKVESMDNLFSKCPLTLGPWHKLSNMTIFFYNVLPHRWFAKSNKDWFEFCPKVLWYDYYHII